MALLHARSLAGLKLLPPCLLSTPLASLPLCSQTVIALQPPAFARRCGRRGVGDAAYAQEAAVGDLQLRKMERLQKEVKGLRADVRKLTIMLEQDFIGSRRGEESSHWRRSSDGPAPLSPLAGGKLPMDLEKGSFEESQLANWRQEIRPTVETARMQPTHICEMGHNVLAQLALQGNHHAHRERMIREIMSVDNVSWEEAHKVLEAMDEYKEKYYWPTTMPYRIGICIAFCFATASCLLVFHPPLALWYGEEIAGFSLKDDCDKDSIDEMTINKVGMWTWQWMEPMIGTASFMLLCAQFMRAQFVKMHMKTFLDIMESKKADRLARKFTQYDKSMVRTWAKPLPRTNLQLFPIYERTTGMRGPSTGL